MPKPCERCSRAMRTDRKERLCKQCCETCECGRSKDFRAVLCRACASRLQAKDQWATRSAPLREGLVRGGIKRLRRFVDLVWRSFCMFKQADGRAFAYYWDDQEKRRYIYRYQWVWVLANGPIVAGVANHHLHEKPTPPKKR